MGSFCSAVEGDVPVFERQLATQKKGHYTWSPVWGYRSACMRALVRAEQAKGAPVYLCEVFRAWDSMIPKVTTFFVLVGLQDLYRNDEILCDKEINRFTTNRAYQKTAENDTEFELFSDRMQRLYPTYQFDHKCRLRPGPETPRTNLNELKSLLLSTDLERD